MLHFLLN